LIEQAAVYHSLTAVERSERYILRYGVLCKWPILTKGSVKRKMCLYEELSDREVENTACYRNGAAAPGRPLAQRRIAEEFSMPYLFVSCLTTLKEA